MEWIVYRLLFSYRKKKIGKVNVKTTGTLYTWKGVWKNSDQEEVRDDNWPYLERMRLLYSSFLFFQIDYISLLLFY